MLTSYLNSTRRLLQNPAAPISLSSDSDLTSYINTARGQVAGESESIRILGTISTVLAIRNYKFSSINTGIVATTGVQGVINVRALRYAVASGFQWVKPQAWEWFDFFYMNNPVPVNGPPQDWAQYGQGAAGPPAGSGATGSFFLNPPPDLIYTLTLDCVCYPQTLVTDGDVEAVPYLWTDAVPYFAAYLALMSAQTGQRIAEAEKMFTLYKEFVQRARQFSNPSVLRGQYAQEADPTQASKLGQKAGVA